MSRKKSHKQYAGLSSEERVMTLKKRTRILICESCRNVYQRVSGMLDGISTIIKDVDVKSILKNNEDM